MEYAVGAGLAVAVVIFAAISGFDRDRAFYPTALVVTASYYDLFAVLGGSMPALGAETIGLFAFIVASVVGFRTSLWVVAAAFVGHGLFDLIHGRLIANPGMPAWWPMFCLSFDVVAAAGLAWRLVAARQNRA
jgi:hypothetical protein